MCGFVCCVGINEEWVTSSIGKMIHRGPDCTGYLTGNGFTMAHNRLAIIDLDPRSNQPMKLNDDIVMLFNGEIFNYLELKSELIKVGVSFDTASDSEVILKGFGQYGVEIFDLLNGQFAITILTKDRIYLARDFYGQKPLYYFFGDSSLYVSSELTSFKSLINGLSKEFLSDFLRDGFSKVTPFENVQRVNSGDVIVIDRHTLQVSDVYRMHSSHFVMPVDGKRVDVLRELDVVLNRSVKRHLVADVPVGLLLSGGIDSSLIASYIKDNSNIKCFTVDFGDNQDEIQNAKAIATCFGLKLEILELRDSVSFERYLEIIQKMPEPIGDSSFIPVYLITEMIRKQGITVVLTGDGADELFAGYSLYKYLLVIYKWFRILSFLNRFTSIISYGLPVKIKKWFDAVKALKNGYHPNLRAFFSPDEIFNITGHRIKFQEKFKGKNLLKQFMLDDFKNYLSLGLLFKNDSASMANSIELRSPFLDNEVYEFVKNNVPTRELLFKGQNKSLLREHAGNVFPSDYSFNSKRGFNFANSIISDDFYQQCLYYINANLKGEKKISSLLKKAKDGNVRDFHRFHILFVFMIWNSKNT